MSPVVQAVTLTTRLTLPQARVLAGSLRRHCPTWPHDVVLLDAGDDADLDRRALNLRSAADVLGVDLAHMSASYPYSEEELIETLVPRLLAAYAEQIGGPVMHLPATAWVVGDLEPIAGALARNGVLLVPRTTAELPDDGAEPSALDLSVAGRVSPQMIGIDGSANSRAFLAWWSGYIDQLRGPLNGQRVMRPEDGQWLPRLLELAPARFATGVLNDLGCNLSLWNLHDRVLTTGADGVLVDGRWPARFLDLPGFRPDCPFRLHPAASRVRVSRSPALRELCVEYAGELERAGWAAVDLRRDIGRTLTNGLVYDEAICALHARAVALGANLGDLFDLGADAEFLAWLAGPAPAGSSYGINRYVFHRVARERRDVVLAFPDLDGPDGPRYVEWCWTYGRREIAIPDRFLPPQPPGLHLSGERSRVADERTTRAREDDNALPATGALHDSGAIADLEPVAVRVTGFMGHTLGVGAAARAYATALDAAGVAVSTASVSLDYLDVPVELHEEYGRHQFVDQLSDARHDFELLAINPDELPYIVERLGDEHFQGRRIGIWGWESTAVPDRWRDAFGLVEEIWVYSKFIARNLTAASPVPVVALPPPVERPAERVAPRRLGVPEGFLFLFVFDYLSTVRRKNPVAVIEAFKLAFEPGAGPQLLIKTINAPLRPLGEEELLWAAAGRPDIHIIDRSLSADERDGLMAGCDCYVSLHRAEGFGLTMAEAMSIGKPVIATAYSGNVDFMNAGNSFLVEYEICRVGPDGEMYPADGTWAEPSVEHAARLMREANDDRELAARIGARAAQDIARVLSPQATGQEMRARLEELAGIQRSPAACRPARSGFE